MWTERTARLVGQSALEQLGGAHILIVGLGGVGASCVEALTRAGIGRFTLVDSDEYEPSNLNRQLYATIKSLGKKKVEVARQRILDINPMAKINCVTTFVHRDNLVSHFAEIDFDLVVDAIDTLQPKVDLLDYFYRRDIPLVSIMGAGGRVDPLKITIADISKTKDCMLAKNVRKRLVKRGIYRRIACVFSTELVDKQKVETTNGDGNKKSIVGTISYMPIIFGQIGASVVIKQLLQKRLPKEEA